MSGFAHEFFANPGDEEPIEEEAFIALQDRPTRARLLALLRMLQTGSHSMSMDHVRADHLLLRYLDDPEITAAFCAIPRWYS